MPRLNLKNAVIISVVGHALFFISTTWIKALSPAPNKDVAVTIDLIEEPQFPPTQTAQKQEPRTKPKYQQLVDQNLNPTDKAVDTRFLSEKNQVVEKQTVAKERGEFQNAKNTKKAGDTGSEINQKQEPSKDTKSSPNLFAGYDPNEGLQREQEKNLPRQNGENGQKGTGEVSRTDDYLRDVDQGLETLLNTREFKYYSYYNRIRKQLSQHWEGEVRARLSKLFKEGRAPAATNQDRITKVIVVLNQAGTLVKVQILSDSGVRDLDEAAIEAFRAAAPFPNPPKGLIESDGTVKIRWDFVLES
ncbi:MAG: TonB family protein [Bdellovibrionia bacterium]